ncbi:helix-turn-helix domain-containing protein [candidate division KSB1 bacterium]
MSKYIQKLIEEGEHQKLDFKFEITDSKKIARSLVAFSNTDGGTLLVGVKDNGAIAGVRSDEEIFMIEGAAQLYTKPEIILETREWIINGKTVLEIIIPKKNSILHYAPNKESKWRVYVRVKDQNLMVNKAWLNAWKRKKDKVNTFIKYTEKEKSLLEYLEKNKIITLNKFSKLVQISRNHAENILVNFIVLDIIEILFTEKQTYYCLKKLEDPVK